MTPRDRQEQCLHEREQHAPGTLDYEYLTMAAHRYDQLARGVPVSEWEDKDNDR